MGFTMWLMILYIVLIVLTVLSFVKKKKAIGVFLSLIMVLGIVVLGYLWVTSPM